jgi:multidrug efflux pump subunit AcrB
VYLRDVAEVDDGFIEPRRIVEVDGRRAMMMMVVADELAPKVMEALKGLRDTIGQTEGVKAFPLNVEGQL